MNLPYFDILICSWNNLPYLQCLVKSLYKNSCFKNNILVHVNEGKDNTADWLDTVGIKYTRSESNLGLCKGTNSLSNLITSDFVCICDDDMYVLPRWDLELLKFRYNNSLGSKYWISSTMIEPKPGPVTTISPKNYGTSIAKFQEDRLLADYPNLKGTIAPMNNQQAVPMIMPSTMWQDVNGYDEDFGPGSGAEEGLAKKLWDYGCRNFVSISDSLVYHFQCKSTSRQAPGGSQNRDKQMLDKYGITTRDFTDNYIKRGQPWKKQLNF